MLHTKSMIDPQSEKTIGYHLFVMPEGKAAEDLSGVMQTLANTFQGSTFAPHVTVLARIPSDSTDTDHEEIVLAKAKLLASTLSPLPIVLSGIGAENSFFRALYLHVSNPEKVSRAHAHALEIFSMTEESPYVPHLSLIYGNFSEEIIEEMKECVRTELSMSDAISFTAYTLHLYRTEGAAEDWMKIGEFPFPSPSEK